MLLFGAAAVLAFHPLFWLVQTWMDPSYDSKGFLVFLFCAGLFVWSVSSQKTTCRPVDYRKPFVLLGLSAGVRLAGQVLAVNVIGAITLLVDVFAISHMAGLQNRVRAVSPFWLAVCFGFSLPLERIVQRMGGYGLQHLSAEGACGLLGRFFDNVACNGVRILIEGQDVLVDLPCSGARSVLLLLFFYCCCAAVGRFHPLAAFFGGGVALISALLANMLRICILAIGIAFPIGGFNVMAQPLHDMIGLFTLALGCLPLVVWTRRFARKPERLHPVLDQTRWIVPYSVRRDGWWLDEKRCMAGKKGAVNFIALACVLCALLIVNLPRKAVDVVRTDIPLSLPHSLNGNVGVSFPLSEPEKAYFTQFGGAAQKASYGGHSLLMVRTSAPLRHLHAPDECLRGLGMRVEYKGAVFAPLPTALYKASDREGNSYRIAVSFMSDDRLYMTTNVSEAVWLWMQNPGQVWTAVQRISPWEADQRDNDAFDRALFAALDIRTQDFALQLASKGEPSWPISKKFLYSAR